jgi:hypothetical protein
MAEFHVRLTVNQKAEPYIVWLEKNRPALQVTRTFSARDPRPHIVVILDATDTTDATNQAVKAWDEARASAQVPGGIYASEAGPIAMTAWKVSENPPSGYNVAGKPWRVLLSMDGGWKGSPPDSEAVQSRVEKRAPGLTRFAPKQFPVGPTPVFYELEAPASLKPGELKEIVDAALTGWAEGKTVTAKVLDPAQGNKIMAE